MRRNAAPISVLRQSPLAHMGANRRVEFRLSFHPPPRVDDGGLAFDTATVHIDWERPGQRVTACGDVTLRKALWDWASLRGWPQLRFPEDGLAHGVLIAPDEYSWRRFISYASEMTVAVCWVWRERDYKPSIHGRIVGYEVDGTGPWFGMGTPRCERCGLSLVKALGLPPETIEIANEFGHPNLEPICSKDAWAIPAYCATCQSWIETSLLNNPVHLIHHPALRDDARPRLRIRRFLDEDSNRWRELPQGSSIACDCCDWPAFDGYQIDRRLQRGLGSSEDEDGHRRPDKHSKYARIGQRLISKLCPACVTPVTK